MNILRVISGFDSLKKSGPISHAMQLSESLSKQGIKCTLLTTGNSSKIETEILKGFKIIKYPFLLKRGNIYITPGFFKIVTKIESDIIHLHGYRSLQIEAAARSAVRRKTPYILSAHGSITGLQYFAKSSIGLIPHKMYDALFRRFVLKHAAAIVANSISESIQLKTFGVNEDLIKIIPHGVDPPPDMLNLQKLVKHSDNFKLLFVGRIAESRNLPMILRALDLVRRDIPNVRLTVCGDFFPESSIQSSKQLKSIIRNLIRNLHLEHHIQFKGWVTGSALWSEYLASDLFLWSSKYDSFGHSLVESALCEVPLVSTPTGVAPEITSNGAGYLIRHGDYEAMAERITLLLRDRHLRIKMGKKACKNAEFFSESRMVSSTEFLYQDIDLIPVNR